MHGYGVRVLLSLALVTAVLVGAPQASSAAGSETFETPRCAGAPLWRIRYHLYWQSSNGNTLDVAGRDAAVQSARSFTEAVGDLGNCAVRVRIDLVDEVGAYSEAVRTVTPGYDADFYRYPRRGDEAFSGQTDYRTAIFPVSPGWDWEPNSLLLMHEWLHMVVMFYDPPNGWPRNDVHGACERPDYLAMRPGFSCMILPEWFRDLMTGQVLEDGVRKGLPVPQWAYQGTPLNPLHADPGLRLWLNRPHVVISSEFSGDATVQFSHSGQLVSESAVPVRPGVESQVRLDTSRYGRWTVCAMTPEVIAFRPGKTCIDYRVDPNVHAHLRIVKRARYAVLRVTPPLVGKVARITFKGEKINLQRVVKRRSVVLKRRVVVRYPPWGLTTTYYLDISTRRFTQAGVEWPRGFWGRQIRY